MISNNEFDFELKKTGFDLSQASKDILIAYLEKLMQWNKVMNLVGTHTWQDTLANLIIDSFHLSNFLEKNSKIEQPVCWDLGAGAGLPGIALRSVWNKGKYIMVEAREKRALFLSNILSYYPIKDTCVYHGRVEDFFAKQIKENRLADIILSRAFMPWQQLINLTTQYIKINSIIIFLSRSEFNKEQLSLINKNTDGYMWQLIDNINYYVNNDKRYIWALEKALFF